MAFGDVVLSWASGIPISQEGIGFDSKDLWIVYRPVGPSWIYQYDRLGNQKRGFVLPGTSESDVKFDGKNLVHHDQSRAVPDRIYWTDLNGNVIRGVAAPGTSANWKMLEPWNGSLWVTDFIGQTVYLIDLFGNIKVSYVVGFGVTGIATDGKNIYLIDYTNRLLYQMSQDFNVIRSVGLPGSTPIGLVFDGKYLWHSDRNGNVYQLSLS